MLAQSFLIFSPFTYSSHSGNMLESWQGANSQTERKGKNKDVIVNASAMI